MAILVLSDLHLFLPVNQKKLFYIENLVKRFDRVIINGDFFDGYMVDFQSFLSSDWKKLFPLLKKKRTIYIYGNHDKRNYSDSRVSLFSDIQAERYKLKAWGKVFVFEHGHKIRVTPDSNYKIEGRLLTMAVKTGHFVRRTMTRFFGKLFLWTRFGYRNILAKKTIKRIYSPKENEIYVIGHNHWGEVDVRNNFAASGMTLYGISQYLVIKDGEISLHEQKY